MALSKLLHIRSKIHAYVQMQHSLKKILLSIILLFIHELGMAQTADRVFVNAKIYKGDNQFDQALAIKNGIIIFTGTNMGAKVYIDKKTRVDDLGGRLVLPGLHDVHMHPLEAFTNAIGDFFFTEGISDPEDYVKELKKAKIPVNSNGWKMGFGHDIYVLLQSKKTPRKMLDEICPDYPMFVWEATSHSAWLNTPGLRAAGFYANTPDPVGGHIMKDSTGEPSGIVMDNAGDIALQMAIAINPVIEKENYDGLVDTGLPLIAKNGITSFCEARTYWKQNFIQTWQKIKDNNLLTARVVLTPWGYPGTPVDSLIDALKKLYDRGDDLLKITEVKLYADGLTFNTTAAMLSPYNIDIGIPYNIGLNYNTESRMATLITALEKYGYDFHIHAIGDRGVSESLNAIERARAINGDIGTRHRITHLETVDTSDYVRFKKLNIIADIQVAGAFTNPEKWHDNDFVIGEKRASVFAPLKSIYHTGATVTLSSDYDVSALSPFVGMQHALTRLPQELPNVDAVVKCYTINGAYTMRQEKVTGSLETGKYADLIVTDRDIFNIPVEQIGSTRVCLTLLGGKEVYVEPRFYEAIDTTINAQTAKCLVYPEEVNDVVNLKIALKKKETLSYKICNSKGRQVYANSYIHSVDISNISINTSHLIEGDYTIMVKTSVGKLIGKHSFKIVRIQSLHDF